MKSIDLTGQQVVALRDVETAAKQGATELLVCSRGIVTPSARDFIQRSGLTLRKAEKPAAVCNGCSGCSGCKTEQSRPAAVPSPPATASDLERLFHSPEAEAIKAEIVNVGRKLWQRMYVDGNGGNISVRVASDLMLCTPTLTGRSKEESSPCLPTLTFPCCPKRSA